MRHSEFEHSRSGLEPSGRPPHNFGARIPELDGVRGVAILMVLLYHVFKYTMLDSSALDSSVPHASWTGLAHLVVRATENGGYGVNLFFVLSGS